MNTPTLNNTTAGSDNHKTEKAEESNMTPPPYITGQDYESYKLTNLRLYIVTFKLISNILNGNFLQHCI